MPKKRKSANPGAVAGATNKPSKYDIEERFDDSEDDIYTARDKILLDEQPAAKRTRRLEEQEHDLQPSDEEVLRYESDNADGIEQDAPTESGEEETWGTSKADYYNTDIIETEADAIEEEAEARRLQQKQIQSMTEADFGLDTTTWNDEKSTQRGPVIEKLPDIKLSSTTTKAERMTILSSRYPELEPLARDFVQLQETLSGLTSTKSRALSAYLGAIAMYFAVLTTTMRQTDEETITALPPSELRDHAIIELLIKTRQTWDVARDIQQHVQKPAYAIAQQSTVESKPLKEQKVIVESKIKKPKSLPEKPIKPAKKQRQKSQMLDLQTLLAQPTIAEEESEFGDEALTEEQAAEKAKKKKSLRFYTSQIAQKASKRSAASRHAGGDDDVPHKERMRDNQDRLMREAEKRGQQQPDLLGDDIGEDTQVNDDEYYTSLVDQNKQKKADKQIRAEAYTEAARQGGQVYEEEKIVDGKRAITYAIEKNKGLMPKRKKDVRNPRVKKRNKYEEKKKKLNSMRQVYKGGEGRGGYGGELTGIKTNVVKSVKL